MRYGVAVCDLCWTQAPSLLRFTVPVRTDPNTGETVEDLGGGYDRTLEVCLRCVRTRFISRLVEAAIVASTPRGYDAEPRPEPRGGVLDCAERTG